MATRPGAELLPAERLPLRQAQTGLGEAFDHPEQAAGIERNPEQVQECGQHPAVHLLRRGKQGPPQQMGAEGHQAEAQQQRLLP